MTRNLPEPLPDRTAQVGEQLAYSALAEMLSRANLHRCTGKLTLTIDVNQGGIRAVRIGSDEIYKI